MHIPIGAKFGSWTVVGAAESSSTHSRWLCECECGKQRSVDSYTLRCGKSLSCGCSLVLHPHHLTHGLRHTVVYGLWSSIITRCYNKNSKPFPRYGGRGIKMCEFFRVSPANLLTIMGERPLPHLTIGRIDNNAHYSCGACAQCLQEGWPLNVQWETRKQQARNRCSSHLFTFAGTTKSVAEWAEETGIKYRAFEYRVNHGLDPFTKPK